MRLYDTFTLHFAHCMLYNQGLQGGWGWVCAVGMTPPNFLTIITYWIFYYNLLLDNY